ncbi:hypothetical protein Gohar_018563 [Gossypium harknessii]|uniref:Uncharacterized protein n=1 Tax=Gossypium harknessii TaxID=34285 RepID=A0A7J9G9I6_9ROSI|nr:hypothetical protein [Gossypium harknessii]
MRRKLEVGKVGEESSDGRGIERGENFLGLFKRRKLHRQISTDNKARGRYARMSLQGKLRVRKNTTSEKESVVTVTVAKTRAFRPWMLVDRKFEGPSKNKGLDSGLGQKSTGKHAVPFVKMDKASAGPGVEAHYNPTFKGPEGVKVPMTDGVLDPRKYFAVIFKENLHSN